MGCECCIGSFDEAILLGLDIGIGCVAEEFSRAVCEDCGERGERNDEYKNMMHYFKQVWTISFDE